MVPLLNFTQWPLCSLERYSFLLHKAKVIVIRLTRRATPACHSDLWDGPLLRLCCSAGDITCQAFVIEMRHL